MSQADLDSLVPEVAPSNRREFLKTAVGSAFALAVLGFAAAHWRGTKGAYPLPTEIAYGR